LDFLAQQKVPYFGYSFDFTYCSTEPNPDTWGFGFNGCLVPKDVVKMGDNFGNSYKYVTEKLGKETPTLAIFSADNTSGKNSAKSNAIPAAGAGFDVVFAEGILAEPPIADYTPYVQTLMTSNNGGAPDVIQCLVSTDCIGLYTGLQNAGFTGIFSHTLYSDLLAAPMKGSISSAFWVPSNTEGIPALDQIKADIAAIKSDATLETGSAAGYFSTDMFIQALKTVADQGVEFISPENVRTVAAHQTWQIEGVVGPIKYPESTVVPTPRCAAVVESDGTQWVTKIPYTCSDRTFDAKG
jgi:Periplasmic binding protein